MPVEAAVAAETMTMEITVSKGELLRELTATQGVVERKTTIPVLSQLLLTARGDKLHLAATDLDVSLTSWAEADVKRLTLEATPFAIKVPSSATLQRGLEVNVTGPPKRPVFIRIQITEAKRKALKLRYRTLGTGAGTTDEKGKALVIVQPRKDTAPILLRLVDALPTTVNAVSGDRAAALALDLGA